MANELKVTAPSVGYTEHAGAMGGCMPGNGATLVGGDARQLILANPGMTPHEALDTARDAMLGNVINDGGHFSDARLEGASGIATGSEAVVLQVPPVAA